RYQSERGNYNVHAVNPENIFINKVDIEKGRYINGNDMRNTLKVIVIGVVAAKELFKEEDPIGKNLTLNGLSYRIIGLFSDDDNERSERNMYTPLTTFQRLYSNTTNVDRISLTYNSEFNYAQAINFSEMLEKALKRRLIIDPDDQGAIYINNYAEGFADVASFTGMLSMISIAIGVLILIAGIVGIGNILVFIIKERTKEIGVRKALGARPIDVIKLVLMESVIITSISGLGGMVFAMGLVSLISPIVDAPAFSNPSVDNATVITSTIVL